ncbi:MAG: hypothetical protein D6751_04155 [Deltaproteobacteria bacterium]|nr:MAG: hypothetical protein D6751_04155 [Deltaproteobacteria bacterium]
MENLFILDCQADSLDEAVQKGLAHFGCRRTDIDVRIVEAARTGLFGLFGRRPARYQISISNRLAAGRLVAERILVLAGFETGLEFELRDADQELVIDTDLNALLIGKRGVTLDGLEYLVNGILDRHFPDERRLTLDCGDFRQRQREQVRRVARELVEEARSKGRAMSEPLPADQRQVIHQWVRSCPDCSSRSEGQGPFKKVSVVRNRKRA